MKSKYNKFKSWSSEEFKVNVYKEDRTLYFFDDITHDTVFEAVKLLDQIEKVRSDKPIKILLCTDGGSIYDGFALYDRIRMSPHHIQIIGTGLVASMGIIVYLAGDEKFLTPTARLMFHKGWGEIEGDTDQLVIEAKEMQTIDNICNDIVVKNTKQSLSQIKKIITRGNKYYSAEQAIKLGYADKIMGEEDE